MCSARQTHLHRRSLRRGGPCSLLRRSHAALQGGTRGTRSAPPSLSRAIRGYGHVPSPPCGRSRRRRALVGGPLVACGAAHRDRRCHFDRLTRRFRHDTLVQPVLYDDVACAAGSDRALAVTLASGLGRRSITLRSACAAVRLRTAAHAVRVGRARLLHDPRSRPLRERARAANAARVLHAAARRRRIEERESAVANLPSPRTKPRSDHAALRCGSVPDLLGPSQRYVPAPSGGLGIFDDIRG